jgi:sec-independent protein translocase protein TatA
MGLGWQHILLFLIVALLLFGRGKISELMGDFAKGIKAFKKGLSEEETASTDANPTPKTLEHNASQSVNTHKDTKNAG